MEVVFGRTASIQLCMQKQIRFSIGWILKSVQLCSCVRKREPKSQGEVQGHIGDSTSRLIIILDLRKSLGLERDF